MKIAHVAPFFYPEMGGMENAVLNQCRELVKLKNEVHVFTCDRFRNETKIHKKTDEIYGIKVHYLRSLFHVEKSHFFPSILTELNGDFDVVHTHAMHHYHNDLAAFSIRIRHGKTVFTSHSSFYPKEAVPTYQYYLFKVYDATARLSIFRNVDRVIALTKYDETELVKRGLDSRKIRIIPNGVESIFFERPDVDFKTRHNIKGKIVLYVGRLHKEKSLDVLVRAFPLVLDQNKDANLVLVGPDEGELARLLDLGRRLGIKDHLLWIDRLGGKELVSAYYSCDVFALCSVAEAFGISLMEAQAAGKPVVATDLGGVPYVVKNGETGLLIPPRDTKALANSLNLLLSDDDLRSRMGHEARKWAENFRWEKITRRIFDLYLEMLSE